MSITDELREWAESRRAGMSVSECCDEAIAIADSIDAEHQKALDEWKAENGQMWLKGYSECHAELMEGNETLASDLERCGWVRLPLDADGVPLKVGDEIEYPNGARDTVRFATISPIGWAVNDRGWKPEAMRHYHEPTVEDVLLEACKAYHGLMVESMSDVAHDMPSPSEVIAEYAVKLRLKEDE